jgi:hypothetical protein
MAVDPRKRQKQLQRRAAKRKDKHQLVTREKFASVPERIAAANKYPILDCWMTSSLWTQGIGWVCLSRELPNGFVACAIFLVDRYCLGVKDVIMDVTSRFAYDSKMSRQSRSLGKRERVSPAKLRKFVEDAVAYAQSLGLPPHADYAAAARIFGNIDPVECTETFEFGKDGKPFFIGGPHDTPERCRRIVHALEQACGTGGYDYLMAISRATEVVPLDADESAPDEEDLLLEHEEEQEHP